MSSLAKHLWVDRAWINGEWQESVQLSVNEQGCWADIQANQPIYRESDKATNSTNNLIIRGAVIPGVVNAHSHAFQRAIAGLTEKGLPGGSDDFWSWRQRMYAVALKIDAKALEVLATQLYSELLLGGYTQVCEFNYLHNDANGHVYSNALELSMALIRAAQNTGIGLTLLPTLYMRSGFNTNTLREDQRRFASAPTDVIRIVEAVNRLNIPTINAGVALHSLRAVPEGALKEVAQESVLKGYPIHIHVAEQTAEVDDCLATHGERPIEWLLNHAALNTQWNLVHATHSNLQELAGLKQAGASIVICPTTEANLGDGIFDMPNWLELGGSWSIGSDSHVCRDWREELRLLEYSQRLAHRQRNIAARFTKTASQSAEQSTANCLFSGMQTGASAAAGSAFLGNANRISTTLRNTGEIKIGGRADFCVIDANSTNLAGIDTPDTLDAMVFSSPNLPFSQSWVAGVQVKNDHQKSTTEFTQLMHQLWR